MTINLMSWKLTYQLCPFFINEVLGNNDHQESPCNLEAVRGNSQILLGDRKNRS